MKEKGYSLAGFFIATSLLITNIFFIILSLFGMEYYGKESGGSIFMITVLGVNFVSILYILYSELRYHRKARGPFWPYYIPILLITCYGTEFVLGMISSGSRAESTLLDVVGVSSFGIWSGTFCYRHRKFKEIVSNLEIVLFICTIALVLALPSMFVTRLGTAIGGAGDHQIVSYIAAMAFGFSLCRIRFKPSFGYAFFKSRSYNMLAYIFALLQAVICVAGGGRGGFVMLIFLASIIALYSMSNIRRLIGYGILVLISIIVTISLLGSFLEESGAARAMSIFTGEGDDRDNLRTELYSMTIDYFYSSPIWGHGIFSQYNWCQKVLEQPYCHNFFLELLIQGGLILFLLGAIITIRFAKFSHKLVKKDRDYTFLIPLYSYSFIMLMFSGTYLTTPMFWFVVIFVLGSMSYSNKKEFKQILK